MKGEVGRKAGISWAKADFIHSVSHSQTKGVIPPAEENKRIDNKKAKAGVCGLPSLCSAATDQ